jgi:predicted P-loop ATPase
VIEIVRGHIREGIRPVPIPYRQKGPVIDNWLTLVITEENVSQFFNGSPSNVGGILGAASGNLQDVDLDCPEALSLASLWLPETRTFGRATNPTSHYLYRSFDLNGEGTRGFDDPIAKHEKRKSKLLELRSNGGQTVLPGSTHKDTGELIAWDNPEVPFTECSRATLERTVAGIAAGCMLLRYWRPEAADIFVSTLRAAEWSDAKIEAFLTPMAGTVNLDAPSIDPAAWREALALPRLPERVEEKERKAWEKARSDFFAKMVAWLGFPVQQPQPRASCAPLKSGGRNVFARAQAYVDTMPEAISGSGGHDATFAVARKLVQDFGLNDSEAWTILVDYSARCRPPWSEKELQHKLDSARVAHTAHPVEDRPPPERTYRPEPAAREQRVPDEVPYADPGPEAPPPAPPAKPPSSSKPNEGNWRRHLLTKKQKDPVTGQPRDVVLSVQPNVCTILTFHPAWSGVLVYDEFSECVVKTREPPWPDFEKRIRTEPVKPNAHRTITNEWKELDSKQLVNWLAREENITVTDKLANGAAEVVANAMGRHPPRDYLRSHTWDGVPRLDTMLSRYFKADDTPYTRGVSARWMISAVARVMEPGCQADCALILESKKQGRGKSTGLEILASPAWFADSGLDIGNKDSYQNLRGVWIYEIGELDGVRGREVTKVKNFVGARSDRYRRSYGERNADVPRQGVLAGTTNESEYLQDTTGNRRFLPIKVKGDVDRDALRRDRDQLWAEAHARYLAGEPWHVNTPEFRALCEDQQQDRVRDDIWAPIVESWLKNPTITEKFDIESEGLDGKSTVITTIEKIRLIDVATDGVLTHEVAIGALRKETGHITRGDEMRIATILRGFGYEPIQLRGEGGRRSRRYKKVAEEDEEK